MSICNKDKRFLGYADVHRTTAGFTLLEVLIAIAIIAVALTAVLRLENQSIEMYSLHQDLAIAANLAQKEVAKQDIEEFIEVGESNGDFGEDYPTYVWSKSVRETAFEGVNEVVLTINRQWAEEEPKKIMAVTYYVVKPGASVTLRSGYSFDKAATGDFSDFTSKDGDLDSLDNP